ncbi:MAG: BamA/TamA family outer membrane protein [Bacteroidia bacterium]|nr:BamA/TamA family outer membrane protein [Bacteroidia bacterium]
MATLVSSCFPTKHLTENQILLTKSKIEGADRKLKQNLYKLTKQKPNKKLLGVWRFHLAVYNRAAKGRERKVKWWIKENIGEPPVIMDSVLTKRAIKQMQLYLFNKGYFNSKVSNEIKIKSKKGEITYTIELNEPYIVKKIEYHILDPTLKKFEKVINDSVGKVHKWKNYDLSILESERERITKFLKNDGYYNFSKEYIYYEVDSSEGKNRVTIDLYIKKISDYESHKRYRINNVFIETDYLAQKFKPQDAVKDTLIFNDLKFISNNLNYKPEVIAQTIFIKKGSYYQQKLLEETYKRLSDLSVFKFVNISFLETKGNTLDCYVQLTPSKKQAIIFEIEGTARYRNQEGNQKGPQIVTPGISASAIYRNRNSFHGAEIIEFKINAGLQVDSLNLTTFNSRELGASLNITFPRYLIPFNLKTQSQYFNPKTKINTSYNFEQRINYSLRVLKSSLSYEWKEFRKKTHTIYPFELSLVKSDLTTSFRDRLKELNNFYYLNSFDPHITAISKYNFIFNNQNYNSTKDFVFFRGNVELAGNFFNLVSRTFNQENAEILGLSFPQFVKATIDLRKYDIIDKKNTLVYRLSGGLGLPYGNSDVLPFEKAFYTGGPNSIRAWKIRQLGPGSYNNTTQFEQTGDIKIEANIEYRFALFEALEGALFIDGGNIWTVNEDNGRLGSQFKLSEFWKEIAIGTGIGFRFNFSFLIVRLDMATPIRDPSLSPKGRWVLKNLTVKQEEKSWITENFIFNFGIGYPF